MSGMLGHAICLTCTRWRRRSARATLFRSIALFGKVSLRLYVDRDSFSSHSRRSPSIARRDGRAGKRGFGRKVVRELMDAYARAARWHTSSIYGDTPIIGYPSIYDAAGIYRYGGPPEPPSWSRPVPSHRWPTEVYEQVRVALANVFLAELRAMPS